jgi:hypothetical protein
MATTRGHSGCVCALLRRGAAPHQQAVVAARSGNVDVCMAFLDHGHVDPLLLVAPACASSSMPLLMQLLDRCPDLSTVVDPGLVERPLWKAACDGNMAVVQALLRSGADPLAAASRLEATQPVPVYVQHPRNPLIVQALLDAVRHVFCARLLPADCKQHHWQVLCVFTQVQFGRRWSPSRSAWLLSVFRAPLLVPGFRVSSCV